VARVPGSASRRRNGGRPDVLARRPLAIAAAHHRSAGVQRRGDHLAAGREARTAIIDDTGAFTFAELAGRVNRCANAWTSLGLRMEDRVALLLHDGIDFPTLGAIRAGVFVPCGTAAHASDYEFMPPTAVRAPPCPRARAAGAAVAGAPPVSTCHRLGRERAGTRDFARWIMNQPSEAPVATTTSDGVCFGSTRRADQRRGAVHLHSDSSIPPRLYAARSWRSARTASYSATKLFAYGWQRAHLSARRGATAR
jgi:benzoate-CoA ligase